MKAALFTGASYAGPATRGKWPVPVNVYSSQAAEDSMQWALEQFSIADELGFDWVTVAEHAEEFAMLDTIELFATRVLPHMRDLD